MDDTTKGACSHCAQHFEFPTASIGETIDCPHCDAKAVLSALKTEQPKAMDALKSGLSSLAQAAAITAKQATESVKEFSDSEKGQELKAKVGSTVAGLQADPKKFKRQLTIGGAVVAVLLIGWLVRYQPWKSDLERTQMWADRGSAKAQHRLAAMYDFGEGVDRDIKAALKWYEKAAENGYVDSQFNLGNMYSNREGVRRDYQKAFKWYQKAADQGDAEAQAKIGEMYYEGWGVSRDYQKALEMFQKSDHLGESQYFLGRMHDHGRGVKKDIMMAIEWWEKGADQDHPICLFNIANCYENGDGFNRDVDKAIDYYEQSAELGYPEALHNLSVIHFDDSYGQEDKAKSFQYAERAHQTGYAKGTFQLGLCYHDGVGVRQDQRQSKALIQQAARAGDPDARRTLQQLGRQQMMGLLGAAFQIGFGGDGEDRAAAANARMDAAYHQWKAENPKQFMG